MSKPFLDTNVIIYAYTLDDVRSEPATALLRGGGYVSVQVLNEFVHVSRWELRLDWPSVDRAVLALQTLLEPALPLTVEVHDEARALSRRFAFGFYDSLIVAAAKLAGCRVLYTEDLQDGQVIDGVRISNPFLLA